MILNRSNRFPKEVLIKDQKIFNQASLRYNKMNYIYFLHAINKLMKEYSLHLIRKSK